MSKADKAALELSDKLRKDLLDLCGYYHVATKQLESYQKAISEMEEIIGEALASLSMTTFETEKYHFTRFDSELLIEEKGAKCDLH